MNRGPSSFRSLAVAAGSDSAAFVAAMSFGPYFRRGRPQGRRGFSDRTLGPTRGNYSEFVSGDSHFRAVRDANRGFRPSYNAVPSPPHYGTGQEFYVPGSQHHRSAPPVLQQLQGPRPRPRPYKHPGQAGPSFGNYQPFRPQQMQQQFRPRPSKPPDYREWDYAKPRPPPHCELFTILSYNILADYLATDHWQKLYFHIPRYIMDWNWRKRNLIFELGLWSADIICFQEVDRFQELEAELKPHGYSGIWKMRTGDPADGCAMFWRVSRFKLMHEESIEYNKLGLRDNVAQICVFESQNGLSNSHGASTLSTSCGSAPSNRVVICNIHVLFNPKRGDVKLGQIRVLLERAYAVSKLWDDAPIVICGDFNCTPKSPMYNFITEQKLDLSEVARDKISGQASAEIRPPRPVYPDYRKEAVDDSIQASAVTCDKTEQRGFPLHAQKFARFHSSTNSPSTGSHSESGCSVVDKTFDSCIDEKHGSRIADDLPSHNTTDNLASESMSTQCVPPHILGECLTSAQDDTKSPVCPTRDANKISLLESSCIQFKEIEFRECVESNLQTSNAPDDQIKHLFSTEDHSSDLAITSELTGTYNSDASQLEGSSKKLFPNSHDFISSNQKAVASSVSVATDNHDKPSYRSSCQSVSADFVLDENFESLSLNELADGATDGLGEDSATFLSELNNIGQSPFPDDLDSRSPNHKSHSHGDEILSDTIYDEDEIVTDAGKSSFSPAAWTPAEIQIASGSADCKVMEHPLKLQSAYAEVENPSGLRDSSGEPLVTSYHRRFLGTVDYIWRSEGLQTAKVLAPIPKQVMQQTRGFPTKKWGSDHIALVAEFAFTRNISSEKGRQ